MTMNVQKNASKARVANNPLLLELISKCSCSACNSTACFIKRQADVSKDFSNSNITCFYSLSNLVSMEFEEQYRKECNEDMVNKLQADEDNKKKLVKQSKVSIKENVDEVIMKRDNNPINNIQNITFANSRLNVSPSTAKLSAQIMNVPYKDFEDSIFPCRQERLSNIRTMTPIDIFQKIKDVYKACSCRVCECISGKSVTNELCKCQPCECEDCARFKKKVVISNSGRELLHPGCLCPRCRRDSCRAITWSASKQVCDCLPCECIQCADSFAKSCACKPCQCLECKPQKHVKPQTLVVAAVGDENQTQQVCQCSPCACAECGHRYGPSSNLIRHEMSTGLSRHPRCRCEICLNEACLPNANDTCGCERRDRVMSKPVQRDNTDYDIHSAMITENRRREKDRSDLIAMFASVTNVNPYHSSHKDCSCNQCECLTCTNKENCANALKSSNVLISNDFPDIHNNLNGKCSYCNYALSYKHDSMNSKLQNFTTKKPLCQECVCLISKRPIKEAEIRTVSKLSSKDICRCNACECVYCDKMMATYSGDINDCTDCEFEHCTDKSKLFSQLVHPIERAETLTPTTFKNKMKDSLILNNETLHKNDFDFSSMHSHFASLDDKTKYLRDSSVGRSKVQIHSANNKQQYTKAEIVNHAQYIDSYKKSNCNGKEIDFKTARSIISFSSSIGYNKNRECPTSEYRNRFWESSCNSSEHCPDYLKIPVQTCVNDMLTEESEKTIEAMNNSKEINYNIKPLNSSRNFYDNEYAKPKHISLKPTIEKITDKLSYNGSSVNNNYYPSEEASVSSECCSMNVRKSDKTIGTNCTEHINARIRQEGLNDVYSKSFEMTQNEFMRSEVLTFENSRKPVHLEIINNFQLDEDYERVQRTLKEARDFSKHLMKLLIKYEKANRDFESVSQKLKCNPIKNVFKNTISRSSEKVTISKISSYDCCEKANFIDNVHAKEENSSSMIKDRKHVQESMGDQIDIKRKPLIFINGSKCDIKNVLSNKIKSSNDKAKTDFKQSSSKRLSFKSSDIETIDNYAHSKNNVNSIVKENDDSSNADDHKKRHIRLNQLKRCNNMCKRVVIRSRKAKRFVPQLAKSSNTTETPDSFIISSAEFDSECNIESKHDVKKVPVVKNSMIEKNATVSGAPTNVPTKIRNSDPKTCYKKSNVNEYKVIIEQEIESNLKKCTEIGDVNNSACNIESIVDVNKVPPVQNNMIEKNASSLDVNISANVPSNIKNLDPKTCYTKSNIYEEKVTIMQKIESTLKNCAEIGDVNNSAINNASPAQQDLGPGQRHEIQNLLKYKTYKKHIIEKEAVETGNKVAYNNIHFIVNGPAKIRYLEPIPKCNKQDDDEDKALERKTASGVAKSTRPWPILKKNLCVQPEHEIRVKGFCMKPLEVEIKDVVRSIAGQPQHVKDHEVCKVQNGNRALAQLYTEVQKLLKHPVLEKCKTSANEHNIENESVIATINNDTISEAPVLAQSHTSELAVSFDSESEPKSEMKACNASHNVENIVFHQTKQDLNVSCKKYTNDRYQNEVESKGNCTSSQQHKINNVAERGSYNAMKVSFLTVRKVSNHSVIVKWNAPRDLMNVKGYELLVDGHSVKKILNASSCMVVVTCLPQSNKILLTVKTVTNSPCTSGCVPSATIVYYRPKST